MLQNVNRSWYLCIELAGRSTFSYNLDRSEIDIDSTLSSCMKEYSLLCTLEFKFYETK